MVPYQILECKYFANILRLKNKKATFVALLQYHTVFLISFRIAVAVFSEYIMRTSLSCFLHKLSLRSVKD